MDGAMPAQSAVVTVLTTSQSTRTDASGHFILSDLAPGQYPVQIVHRTDTLYIPSVEIKRGTNQLNLSIHNTLNQ